MPHIVVIGAGITGISTAYELINMGYEVTVLDRQLYPAMETSFANGGQLSASNAAVWNNSKTIIKGMKWMLQRNAPLLLNISPSLHKYRWLLEFMSHINDYEPNTIQTVKLALLSRQRLFQIIEKEDIDCKLVKKGILHICHDKEQFLEAQSITELLAKGGLQRLPVSSEEIKQLEPTLTGDYFAGFYTPDDATGDIHLYTRELAEVCYENGVKFKFGVDVTGAEYDKFGVNIKYQASEYNIEKVGLPETTMGADAVVICAGVGSYKLSKLFGDRVNIYPVKGYSITVHLDSEMDQQQAPWVSLLDEDAKIVTSRLGVDRLRVAGTAEINGANRDIIYDRVLPLEQWVQANFNLNLSRVVPWAGLRPMMPNMMPRLGAGSKQRVFYNTGHGHLGWTLSSATSAMVALDIYQNHQL